MTKSASMEKNQAPYTATDETSEQLRKLGRSCVNTGRKFIGIEMDETYFNIAKERIKGIV